MNNLLLDIFTSLKKIISLLLKKLHFIDRIIKILKFKTQDAVYLEMNKKGISIDINEIKYFHFEIRDIKLQILNHYYFNKIKLNHVYKEHLYNFLLNNDRNLSRKASLINYLINHVYLIKKIKSPFLSKTDRFLFSESNINLERIKSNRLSLYPLFNLCTSIFYVFNYKRNINELRKIYPEKNSRYNSNINYTIILKVFGLHAESIYLNRLNKPLDNTVIYVKPYFDAKGLKRQIEYVNHLISNHRNYFFYAPKYNLKKGLKMAFKISSMSFPRELKHPLIAVLIKELEIDNFLDYIFSRFQHFKQFYTSEEFEAESVYLTKNLQDHKIKVINAAHGLGDYGTIVRYDEFFIISKIQKEKYLGEANFKFYDSHSNFKVRNFNKNKNLALLFIGQTFFSDFNSRTFSNYYKTVINFIEQIVIDLNIPIFAKYHPESTKEDKILSDRIRIIESIEELPSDFNYLSITLGSTYIIELLDLMPFLIINPLNKIDLRNYSLPNNESYYVKNYQEFKQSIKRISQNSTYYYEYWNELCNILNEIMS